MGIIDSAIADDTLTQVEMDEVAIAFGFNSEEQFVSYITDLHTLENELFEKYHLNKLNSSEVQSLFNNAMIYYLNNLANQIAQNLSNTSDILMDGLNCATTFASCTAGAYTLRLRD